MSTSFKNIKYLALTALLLAVFSGVKAETNVEPFLGRWALFLPGGAGWLDVRQESGYLDADILWYGGSVVPVDNVFLNGDKLIVTRDRKVVRKKDAKGNATRTQIMTTRLVFSLYGDLLVGTKCQPNKNGIGVGITKFTGKKIPPVPPAPDLSKLK
ncbi:MAG: hypothetical protein GXO75_00525, partial [Calditrichaeota bacterium]|nr:hypothetical protein [Calditrichota bacterium]